VVSPRESSLLWDDERPEMTRVGQADTAGCRDPESTMIPGKVEESGDRLAKALLSLDDAIELLQWRYDRDADQSVTRLERLRDELRLALALAECDARLLH
jgi:hypothetical protein